MGKFTSHIVLVGLGGVLLPFTSPAKANRGAFLIRLEISHIKRLLRQSSNIYLKYRLPMKDLKLLVYWKQDQYKIIVCCEWLWMYRTLYFILSTVHCTGKVPNEGIRAFLKERKSVRARISNCYSRKIYRLSISRFQQDISLSQSWYPFMGNKEKWRSSSYD